MLQVQTRYLTCSPNTAGLFAASGLGWNAQFPSHSLPSPGEADLGLVVETRGQGVLGKAKLQHMHCCTLPQSTP